MSLTLYSENTMDSTETRVEGPIRDTAASRADCRRRHHRRRGYRPNCRCSDRHPGPRDRWAAGTETFATLYVKKLEPMLDVLLKMIP